MPPDETYNEVEVRERERERTEERERWRRRFQEDVLPTFAAVYMLGRLSAGANLPLAKLATESCDAAEAVFKELEKRIV